MAELMAVAVVAFIILVGCGCMCNPHWRPDPSKEYKKISAKYGAPVYFNTGPDGAAIWNTPGPFERLMVIDDNTGHDTCVYATIKYSVDAKNIQTILIGRDIKYDALKEELTVCCCSIEICIATLVLIDEINKGYIDNNSISEHYIKSTLSALELVEKNYRTLECLKDSRARRNAL